MLILKSSEIFRVHVVCMNIMLYQKTLKTLGIISKVRLRFLDIITLV